MRPYLAVIKDSFREALASRVLWILIVLATLALLLLAPIGMREQAGTLIEPGDLVDPAGLIDTLKRQRSASAPSPGKQVWAHLSDDLRGDLSRAKPPAGWPGMLVYRLSQELNSMLGEEDLHDPAAWKGISISPEARELLDRPAGNRSKEATARMNRLLLEAAFEQHIAPSRQTETTITYAALEFPEPMRMPRKMMVNAALGAFIDIFAGTLAVFAGILVTASIIPQTFDAGAIDLLLSKPISRALLYVAKFLGGCAFLAIIASYLIIGLWLILGLRFGMWSVRLWWCIPVLLFLFSIYYSVSALAGAVWRNAIVSVVVSVLFWLACFSVGTLKNTVDFMVINPSRLIRLEPAGGTVAAVDEGGRKYASNAQTADWDPILAPGGGNGGLPPFVAPAPPVGPVYDPHHQRLYALPPRYPQAGLAGGNLSLLIASPDKKNEGTWKNSVGIDAPAGTSALFVRPEGGLLAVTPLGVYRLAGDAADRPRQMEVFGYELPLGSGGGSFAQASRGLRFRAPLAANMDHHSGAIAVCDGGGVSVIKPDREGTYRPWAQLSIEPAASGVPALGGETLVLGLSDGRVQVYSLSGAGDRGALRLLSEHRPEGRNPPRFVEASGDGRYFSVLFHHRKLWLYDAGKRGLALADVAGQGNISAAAFDGGDRLLVADRQTRLSQYQLGSAKLIWRRQPRATVWVMAYRYLLVPIYTVFPKPGELSNLVNYVLTEETTVSTTGDLQDTRGSRMALNVWGPLYSGLAFVAVMVSLGALYTQRKDF